MKRPAPGSSQGGVSLFPFLAVLMCTMGSLILLLMVIARQARVQAETARQGPTINVSAVAAAAEERDELEWEIQQLAASREKTAEQLAAQRAELSHLEEHAQRLRSKLDELAASEKLLDEKQSLDASARERLRLSIEEVRRRIAELEAKIAEARRQGKKAQSFAIVPYEGEFGTRRRPIYIECRDDSIILQPEGIVFNEDDFGGSLGPSNPLASCVRVVAEHHARTRQLQTGEQPYPLLLVRQSGIGAYYVARAALGSWDSEFGYELVDDTWPLEFPEAEPDLLQQLTRTQNEARRRQVMIARAAPSLRSTDRPTFRTTPGSQEHGEGQGTGHGNSVVGPRYAGPNGGGGPAGGGNSATGGRYTPGKPSGQPGGNSPYPAAGGSGAGGTGPGPDNLVMGSNGLPDGNGAPGGGPLPGDPAGSPLGNGGEPGSGDASDVPGSAVFGAPGSGEYGAPGSANSGAPNSGTPGMAQNGEAGAGPNLTGDPSGAPGGTASQPGQLPPGPSPQGTYPPGQGPQGPGDVAGSDRSAGQSTNGMPGGTNGTASTGGSQAGNSSSGGTGSNGSASSASGAGSMAGGEPAGGGTPSLTINEPRKPGEYVEPLSHARGKDWGLPEAARKATPITRPIQIYCAGDRLTVISDRGVPDMQIDFGPRTVDSVDELVSTVWNQVNSWGIAGRNMYWRPTLSMHVAPDGLQRFHDLEALLAGSGIEVVGKTITAKQPYIPATQR